MSARTPCEARVYLRRSTTKQGSGIETQLEWAISQARELGVTLDAAPADLQHMLARKLNHYKHIYLDDGITGADLDRPGFTRFRRDAIDDARVSHVLIHMTDRFARPEQGSRAMLMEQELQLASITIVFSNRVAHPRRRGERNFGEDVQAMYAYSESGEFLDKLAVRMIQTQANLARKGRWTGGQPPYGFVRVRVMADGTEEEMPRGKSVRQPGSHTEIRPNDLDKIRVWAMALHWCYEKQWGCKRIALELNRLGIPSPDAGRTRTEQGRPHRVSGRWTPSTMHALLRNRAIIGELQYGAQSEGHHRRLGPDGAPRLLEDADQRDGQPRVINNPEELVIRSSLPNVIPQVAPHVFHGAQLVLAERGKHQRGIAKIRDTGKYPLSTRVYDLCCGYPMYGRTSGERRCYTCGKYVNTSGEQCEHNQVDAEAALGFVLGVLRQKVVMYGGRDALRTRLTEIAKAAREQKPDDRADERLVLAALLCDAEGELELLTANLARAADLTENNAIKPLFHRKHHEVSELRALLETMGPSEPAVDSSEGDDAEVERALALFEQIEMLASEDGARQALRPLFQRLNLNLWLNFGEGNKGKRKVRVLTGGILTSGDAPLPRKPYGDDADDDGDRSSPGGAAGGSLPPNCDANDASPVGADRAEDVSFSKVHRGDRIRTCDLLTPSQAR